MNDGLAKKSEEDGDDVNEDVSMDQEEMDEHFKGDLQHLIYNLFRVEPFQAARIFTLQLNDNKVNGRKGSAIVVGDRLKKYLKESNLQDVEYIHSPVQRYNVFTTKTIESYSKKLEQAQLFSQICDLFDNKQYQLVRQILESNLPRKVRRKSSDGSFSNTETRLFHLRIMIDTLWNLDEPKECIVWVEVAIHETMQQMQASKCSSNSTNSSFEVTVKEFIDLLKTLDCCLCVLDRDNDFSALEEPFRARLANNLLDLCVEQVEGKELCLGDVKTTLQWVLLYRLISFTEQQEQKDGVVETTPDSVKFLCSAHDYMGQLGMCTKDDGKLLIVEADAIVKTLFRGVKVKAMCEQMRKNLDQAMFCLYAHPSKKSKLKHLVDHSASNIALRWERCMSPYLYLRPEKLPEYDDFKSNSILADTVVFFKRIVALIPDSFNLEGRNKSVEAYLMSDDTNFPKFSRIPQKERPLLDVLYLLADFYFKNNEFPTALEYYRYDLCFNQDRVDSWFPLALSLVNVLEQKLNETYKDPQTNKILELTDGIIKNVLVKSDIITKCYGRCHELSSRNSMIRIESANFAYTMHSFCTRQLDMISIQAVESATGTDNQNLEPELPKSAERENLKTTLQERAPKYLKDASDNYDKALDLMVVQDEPDELWLLHFMKGKIYEKEGRCLDDCLGEYVKALEQLTKQGAVLPKKIYYNSPPDLALELFEVYYRIHATILKQEFALKSNPSSEMLKCMQSVLNKVEKTKPFGKQSVAMTTPEVKVREDKSQSSETDSSHEPPSKMAKTDEEIWSWDTISAKCLEALESISRRFSPHFKTIHLLAKFYLKTSSRNKDVQKAKKHMWGNMTSSSKASSVSMALFGERKSNNFFNGIWRLPISEVDRAGSFSTHINKCMNTLLDLAMELKEQQIFLEVASQLRRLPDGHQKYLYEKHRKIIAQKAYDELKTVLRTKVEEHISFDSSMETRLGFLFELFQTHSKLRRTWQTKDDAVISLLVDLFKSMGGNGMPEEVINFCTKVASMAKKGMDSPQAMSAIVKGDPVEFMKKEMPSSTTARSNSQSQASSPSSTKASESNDLPKNSAAAAMEYLNAASQYYTNELNKMAAYLQSTTGYTAAEAQALLSAYASYGLLDNVNVSSQVQRLAAAATANTNMAGTSTQRSSSSTIDQTSRNKASKMVKKTAASMAGNASSKSMSSNLTISRLSQQKAASASSSSSGKGSQTTTHRPQGSAGGQTKPNSVSVSKVHSNPYAAKQGTTNKGNSGTQGVKRPNPSLASSSNKIGNVTEPKAKQSTQTSGEKQKHTAVPKDRPTGAGGDTSQRPQAAKQPKTSSNNQQKTKPKSAASQQSHSKVKPMPMSMHSNSSAGAHPKSKIAGAPTSSSQSKAKHTGASLALPKGPQKSKPEKTPAAPISTNKVVDLDEEVICID